MKYASWGLLIVLMWGGLLNLDATSQDLKPGYFSAHLSGEPANRNLQTVLFQTSYSGRVKWDGHEGGRARVVLDGKGRDVDIRLELRAPLARETMLYPSGRFTQGRGMGDVRATARHGRLRFLSRSGEITFEPASEGLVMGTFSFVMERPGRYNDRYLLTGRMLIEESSLPGQIAQRGELD